MSHESASRHLKRRELLTEVAVQDIESQKIDSGDLMSLREANDVLMQNERLAFLVDIYNSSHIHSDIIKQLRNSRGWSQTRLAQELGISQARVSMMESRSSKEGPSISTLARIANVCGHTVQIMFGEKHLPKTTKIGSDHD